MPKSLSISWFLATQVLLGVCDSQVWAGKRGAAVLSTFCEGLSRFAAHVSGRESAQGGCRRTPRACECAFPPGFGLSLLDLDAEC